MNIFKKVISVPSFSSNSYLIKLQYNIWNAPVLPFWHMNKINKMQVKINNVENSVIQRKIKKTKQNHNQKKHLWKSLI